MRHELKTSFAALTLALSLTAGAYALDPIPMAPVPANNPVPVLPIDAMGMPPAPVPAPMPAPGPSLEDVRRELDKLTKDELESGKERIEAAIKKLEASIAALKAEIAACDKAIAAATAVFSKVGATREELVEAAKIIGQQTELRTIAKSELAKQEALLQQKKAELILVNGALARKP